VTLAEAQLLPEERAARVIDRVKRVAMAVLLLAAVALSFALAALTFDRFG
jgi:hypothetical protein